MSTVPAKFGTDDEPVVEDEETLGPESFVCTKLALLDSTGFCLLLARSGQYLDTLHGYVKNDTKHSSEN